MPLGCKLAVGCMLCRMLHLDKEQSGAVPSAVTQPWHCWLMPLVDGMMKAAHQFIAGVQQIEGLEVVGEPEMTVVAFKATRAAAKQ